jgi:predicted CoA-binding protein
MHVPALTDAAREFLALPRLAVVGISRGGNTAGNYVFRKLRDAGGEVFPVNPNAEELEGARCYPDLRSIPGGVDGVVVATHPRVSADIVSECAKLGIQHVWLHRSFGQGSVSPEAIRIGREAKLTLISGGCPLMFCDTADIGHRCMRWILGMTRGLPKEV